MPRIVIGVGIAAYPLHAAGNTWAFLQWVLGFRAAGWDVWIVEDVPPDRWTNAQRQPCPPARSVNLAYWNQVVAEFGLQDRATLLVDGEAPNRAELLRFAREADYFFNISGHFRPRDLLAAPRRRVYVDIDPAFTQIWGKVYGIDMHFKSHELFFSIGLHLGRDQCRAPTAGLRWLPLGIPVMTDIFTPFGEPGDTWTTFTHWYGYPAVEYAGEWYGNKTEEFEKLLDLPSRTKEKLEIASDLNDDDPVRDKFASKGWSMVDARPLNVPWQRYREYAAASRGEFCVAKNGYVRSRCGWFSDRSVMYLALGRPVILQETGWSDSYPAGEGLLPFHDAGSARAALEAVGRDPQRHALAARALAEKYFAAPKVVNDFLEEAARFEKEAGRNL
jgi:hypothetical protein